MEFDTISSGSKGNCTLIFSHGHCIQLDFGISKKRVEKALAAYCKSFSDIEAFLITHDHSDHRSNISSANKDLVFASTPHLTGFEKIISGTNLLLPFVPVKISVFTITPIPLSHDAANTVGFLINDGEETLCYITDTGFVPEKDFPYLRNLNYYLFESNHDPKMLYESKRPDYLIRRIISDTGHLSNTDSAIYLSTLIGDNTKEIVLSHLSDECNTPEIAKNTYRDVMIAQLGFVPSVLLKVASDKVETKGGSK